MTLRELIAAAALGRSRAGGGPRLAGSEADLDAGVTSLAYRSDAVTPGTLFFCVPGFTADGHDFAAGAVERGAVALVCERSLGLGVPELVVESVRAAMPPLAAGFYGHPTRSLAVAGITGTNGKTTTAFLLRELLEASGRRTGLLGTVQSVIGGAVEPVERTTPEAIDLQRLFRRMVDAGDAACVMEVSSHALALHRADAIEFDCAVFTNLTQDHLDFHDTLDAYFDSKQRLFTGGKPPAVSIVNVDDDWGVRLSADLDALSETQLVTYAVERHADFRADEIRFGPGGSSFRCRAPSGTIDVRLPLPGLFNVYNALAALAAAEALGAEHDVAAAALGRARRVPGRFEPVDEGQEFTVLVDYAHTPDSLANALRAARELLDQARRRGRLVCVFGAGGDRDRDKRPLMGEEARSLSDHVIVTSDNPRSEDPDAIIAAIVAGAERAVAGRDDASVLEVEPDRRSAIARALRLARADDVVLIAGKGHEQGQEFEGGRKVPFDDREVVREELRSLAGARAGSAA